MIGPDGRPVTAESAPEEIEVASIAELMAGRLPLRAQWRVAEQRERAERGEPGAFTSDLTVEEFAAIRSVGFRPVGQVLGTAVYDVSGVPQGCGVGRFAIPANAPVVSLVGRQDMLKDARRTAVSRMRQECWELGGDGVVGVRVAVRTFHDIGLEFLAIGTAVRADGTTRARKPFTSDLSGQDFAKLLRAGWVPVALVQGVAVKVRHNDWLQRMQTSSWSNQELIGPTALISAARSAARSSLADQARGVGAQGVVLRDMTLFSFECPCMSGLEGEDKIAEATMWGTAIASFGTGRHRDGDVPLSMMRLNPVKGTR